MLGLRNLALTIQATQQVAQLPRHNAQQFVAALHRFYCNKCQHGRRLIALVASN
jgi:hypothetical protein